MKTEECWTWIVKLENEYVVALVLYEGGFKKLRCSTSPYDAAPLEAAQAAILARRVGGSAVHFNPITGALETA